MLDIKEVTLSDAEPSAVIFRIIVIFIVALAAALIFIPNRYWVDASKRLSPPPDYRETPRPDPWG